MIPLKNTSYYDKVLKEFNYSYADVYIFETYVVSEVKEGINFTWEHHAKQIVEDASNFYKSNGENLVYISHRINSYSVVAADWLKFFKLSYSLKGYGVVGYKSQSFLNTMIENLFFKKKIKRFSDLDAAIDWATNKELSKLTA